MFSTKIIPAAIALLCAFLVGVYWVGATVYSDKIEKDISARTQQEINQHKVEIPDIARSVDGREVKVFGSTANNLVRTRAGDGTSDVWGVRTLDNQITVIPETYYLNAEHNFPNLRVSGQVDEASYDLITDIHQALPPESGVDYSGLEIGGTELPRSSRIVETGVAAVTQLNPGTLDISNKQFILKGTVFSEDRKRTVEQLIDVRRAEIEPLEIIVDINVGSPSVTQACLDGIDQVLANNVLNYAVNHYKILDKHRKVLQPMTETILGVCQGQIVKILVEGHADYTGGVGYNQGLSERRSGTVQDYMIEQGVDSKLISAFGYGEFRPIASNETVDGRARNRRTEIYLLVKDQLTGNTVPAISLIEE